MNPGLLHITLRFLGETSADGLLKLQGWESAVQSLPGIAAQIGPLGAFPNLKNPRVLFLQVTPPDPFLALFQCLERWLAGHGIPPEPRPYHPHLTISRVRRGPAPPPDLLPAFDPLAARFSSVGLYESLLSPSGSTHLPLATASFR
ncbi:MAG: 2'-5' RNA ligase [Candidatus Lindowbacteria bacterium RIFCSPLOWO2_12_FULL_62_27]|nr:MAG: 2'-5' RNA ligase [Candidatus Lindowbacteria bacterium RIFCSPLOWO2_12_FULL_62_27]